jgi:hypothetical protein
MVYASCVFLSWYEFSWTASVVYLLATDPEVRFPALPDTLRRSESGTGSTQPPEYNWGAIVLGRTSSGSGLDSREYGCRDPTRWSRGTFYQQTLVLNSTKSGGRSVGIVRLRTQTSEFSFMDSPDRLSLGLLLRCSLWQGKMVRTTCIVR